MNIFSNLFEAFLKCPTKCWLCATGEPGSGNDYAEWVKLQTESFRATETERLLAETPKDESAVAPASANLKTDKWRFAVDVVSEMLGRAVNLGRIIHGDDHATLKVKTSALAGEVRKRIGKMTELLANPAPPDLVLNRHCAQCEFQARCRKIAVEKDDLSLLAGMSAKERQKLRSKGIFTVTQLSYTFRPRRRPKRLRDKREKYHHALKALAIREKKIHIVGSPELKIDGTPVYLDVEGLPDRDFYYLIGLRIGNGDSAVQHSLWADTVADEGKIWREFLAILETVEKPVLIHYGSYETMFLTEMKAQFGIPEDESAVAKVIQAAKNLLSVIFERVYFPTLSNGLKEIARHLGFQWSSTLSGIQTIIRRSEWAASKTASIKQALLVYNAEDCKAVETLANRLIELHQVSAAGGCSNEVVDAGKLKREHPYGFKRNTFAFPELDAINNAAYWDYRRERVYLRSNPNVKRALNRTVKSRTVFRPNKTIECSRPRKCSKCASEKVVKHTKYSKTIFDLKFMRHGIKRWITRYRFHRYLCQNCGAVVQPEETRWGKTKFGTEIIAYAIYLNIELRLPQMHVASKLNRLFGFELDSASIGGFKEAVANKFKWTYDGEKDIHAFAESRRRRRRPYRSQHDAEELRPRPPTTN